jgi:cytosine/adenosine deaminase-related metal-dependent hydrolase
MRFLSATHLFSGKEFLKASPVLVINDHGRIEDLLSASSIEANRIEQHEGILMPGFINTHCHLELSHLKDRIARHTGIVDFGLSVIRHRNDVPEEQQVEQMQQADRDMASQGIVAVGDISNTALSASIKQGSTLHYHSFVELIALNPERAELVFDAGKNVLEAFRQAGLAASLAPHAPYSCSKELIRLITAHDYQHRMPTSIHNQESKAENDFFLYKTGDYLRLYETIGLPIDYFTASGKSSLKTALEAFQKDVNTLLVHNTFTNRDDVYEAQKALNTLYWCLCPNANLYIENSLPDVELLLSENCNLTLGTDSLASNSGLSIMQEIATLQTRFPEIPLEVFLRAATWNGACFLGIDANYGSLEKGKTPGILVIDPAKGSVKKLA